MRYNLQIHQVLKREARKEAGREVRRGANEMCENYKITGVL